VLQVKKMTREEWMSEGMSAFSQLAVLLELANRELQCRVGPSTAEAAAAAAATAFCEAPTAAAGMTNSTGAQPQAAAAAAEGPDTAAEPACSMLAASSRSSSGGSAFEKMLQVLQKLVTKGEWVLAAAAAGLMLKDR
jgi:hypothetical protein